jgi:hypothetical protein
VYLLLKLEGAFWTAYRSLNANRQTRAGSKCVAWILPSAPSSLQSFVGDLKGAIDFLGLKLPNAFTHVQSFRWPSRTPRGPEASGGPNGIRPSGVQAVKRYLGKPMFRSAK